MKTSNLLRTIAASAAACMLWDCSGGGHAVPPPAPAATVRSASSSARFTITLPAKTASAGTARKSPAYISASTQSLAITLTANDQGFAAFATSAVYVNLTPSDPACSGTPLTCTVTAPAFPGNNTFSIVTYDAPQVTNEANIVGNALSQNVLSVNIPAGSVGNVPLALDGITTTFLTAPAGAVGGLSGSSAGLTLTGTAAQLVNIEPVDAQGNVIVGSGAPTVTLVSSAPNVTVAPSSGTTFSLQGVTGGTVTLTATATAATSTSGVAPIALAIPLTFSHAGGASAGASPTPGASGTIFAGIGGSGVDDFPNGTATATATAFISAAIDPQAMAIGPDGTLFASNGANAIGAYPNNSTTPSRTIGAGSLSTVTGLAVDPSGNLYVAETGNAAILVFAPSDTTTPSRTITNAAMTNPTSVACDKSGNLYALDFSGHAFKFAAGTATLSAGFPSQGVDQNFGIAVDAGGTVYQGSRTSQTIYEYLRGDSSNVVRITGLSGYKQLTIDSSGNLLVLTTPGISEYAKSGSFGTAQTAVTTYPIASAESVVTFPNLVTP